jgi:hypothetical protein
VDWRAASGPEWEHFTDAVLGVMYGTNILVGANLDSAKNSIPREVTVMRSEEEILLTPTCVADYKYSAPEGTNAAWSSEDDKSCVVSGLYDIRKGAWRMIKGESIMPRIYCDADGDAYWMFGQYKTNIRANGVPGPAGEGDRILVARGELSVIDGVRGVIIRKIWDAAAGDNRFVDISEASESFVPRIGTWAYAFAIDETATPDSAVTDVFMGPIDTKELDGDIVYFVGYDAAQSIGTLVGQFSLKRALMETGRKDEDEGADALPFLFLNCGFEDEKEGAWRNTGSWRFIPTHDKGTARDTLTVEHSGAPVTNDSYTEEDEFKAVGADMRINGVDAIYKECKPDADVSLIEWGKDESPEDVTIQTLNSFGKIPSVPEIRIPEILGLLRNVVQMDAPRTGDSNLPVFNWEGGIKGIPGDKEFCKALNAFFYKDRDANECKSLLKPAISNQELRDILTYLLVMQGGSNLAVDNRINVEGGPAQKEYNKLKPVPLYNQLIINAVISHIYDLIGEEKELNNLKDFEKIPVNGYDANQWLQTLEMKWGASNGEVLYKALTDFHDKGYGLASKTDVRKVSDSMKRGLYIPVGATISLPREYVSLDPNIPADFKPLTNEDTLLNHKDLFVGETNNYFPSYQRTQWWNLLTGNDDKKTVWNNGRIHPYDLRYWAIRQYIIGTDQHFVYFEKDGSGENSELKCKKLEVLDINDVSSTNIREWQDRTLMFTYKVITGIGTSWIMEYNGMTFRIFPTDSRFDGDTYIHRYTMPFITSPASKATQEKGVFYNSTFSEATGIIPGTMSNGNNSNKPIIHSGRGTMEGVFNMSTDKNVAFQGMPFVVVQRIL